MSDKHAELVQAAAKWLRKVGCRVVLCDPFRAHVTTGEQPDAIGWRDGLSILVEAKVSMADFLKDRKKPFRIDPSRGMGDWRFFIAPAGLLDQKELPQGWGLLTVDETKPARMIIGPKGNTSWWTKKPFDANTREENRLLVSALALTKRTEPITRRGMTDYSAWYEELAKHEIQPATPALPSA